MIPPRWRRRALFALCFLVAAPLAAQAQTQVFLDDRVHPKDAPDWTAAVDLHGQYFAYNTVPNQMLNDYTGYTGVAGEQMDLLVHAALIYGFRLDVEPYAWIGNNQWISRIGLIGEVSYDTPLEWLSAGYGHHSWHNIDVASASTNGHQSDWFFARVDLPKIEFDEHVFIRFSVKPSVFVDNREPLLFKEVYTVQEPGARAMLGFPVIGAIHDFGFEILPYVQFGPGGQRVGITSEFEYEIVPFLAPFLSAEFVESTNGRRRTAIGIGLTLRLKR
jgi:hypothetical protein